MVSRYGHERLTLCMTDTNNRVLAKFNEEVPNDIVRPISIHHTEVVGCMHSCMRSFVQNKQIVREEKKCETRETREESRKTKRIQCKTTTLYGVSYRTVHEYSDVRTQSQTAHSRKQRTVANKPIDAGNPQ